MESYHIITDSTSDLSKEYAVSLGVEIIPMEVHIDDKTYNYAPDCGDISVDDFYVQLRCGKKASTSQINPLTYERYFEKHLRRGIDVLYICFSSGLSGNIQSAQICAGQLMEKYPERRIVIVDSLCAAVGEGLLCSSAFDRKKEGMSLDEMQDWLLENRLNVCHWFIVDDLLHLLRGGRISAGSAVVGTALSIKPVLHVDSEGCLMNVAKARGRRKAISILIDHMADGWLPEICTSVFIGHGDCLQDAEYIAELVRLDFPNAQISIFPVGPIIGAHTGPGMLALAYWGSNR